MKRTSLLFFGFLMVMTVVFAGILPVSAQTPMKDELGVDFGEDFAIVVDFNANSDNLDDIQVVDDLINPSNSKIRTSDSHPDSDQEYYLAHVNESGVHNSYFALNNLKQDIYLNTLLGNFKLGTVEGSAPFQTLLQYFPYDGDDVFVANTFRGYMAYTTNSTDETIDLDDEIYIGYTLVEQNFITLLNGLLGAKGFDLISQYGYEPIFESGVDSTTFGMNYTNFFVVWQKTEAKAPSVFTDIPGVNTEQNDFKGVVTGGDIVAASLFDYLTFTYKVVKSPESNETHTFVDVITEYDVGPMNWLITTDSDSDYTNIVGAIPEITDDVNAFNTATLQVDFALSNLHGTLPDVSVVVPPMAFYTGEAVSKRINATAVQGNADGFGIAVVTTTNVHRVGATVTLPGASLTDGQEVEIPLNFGGDTVFKTSFVGKSTYDRTLYDGTPETGLPVYVTTKYANELPDFQFHGAADAYFKAQSLQTRAFTMFTATQLSPVVVAATTSSQINMDVASTAYATFVQMPKWSGLEVTQDPTYTAVSLVGSGDGETTGTSDSSIVTSQTSGTGPVPGFEVLALMVAFIPLIVMKKRK
ncbi:MAG: hypothetical protein ACXAC2_21060 [Candidatus Kariarchaeaceae archaeon]|jgi:hypothetical protein